MKGTRASSIPLITAMSLVISAFLLFLVISETAEFFGSTRGRTNNADMLPEFISYVLNARTSNVSVTRSFDLSTQDMFYFFNPGDDDIELVYTGDGKYENFVFSRPDDCSEASCICHCNDGPYWERIEEEPYLITSRLRAGDDFTCGSFTCQALTEDLYFVNSRGSTDYFTQRYPWKFYNPINIDIPVLLHYMSSELTSTNPDIRTVHGDDNPFYENDQQSYTKQSQSKTFADALNFYSWKGGYIYGGYGIEDNEEEDEITELISLPSVLRIEPYPNGVLGMCLHENCLFEADEQKVQEELLKSKIQEDVDRAYERFTQKLDRAPTCYDGLSSGQADSACTPLFEILGIYLVDNHSLIAPQFIFEVGNQAQQFSRISFVTSEHTYEELTTPLFFGCTDEEGITTVPSRLQLLEYADGVRFTTFSGTECDLSILDMFPADQLPELDFPLLP